MKRAYLLPVVKILLLFFLILLFACGADENTVEGKQCVPKTTDTSKTCVQGYTCVCGLDGCFCEKEADQPDQ